MKKAAELGSCFAMVELAFLYENGEVVEQSYESFRLAPKAAGQEYPYAMYRVGLYLDRVIGEPRPEEAFAWYAKAAERGDGDAIFALGRCYKNGIGTEENPDKALEWFTKGAENNEPRCLTEMGLAYEYGSGIEENPHQAVEYMTKAAEQNYGYAQFKMGDYFSLVTVPVPKITNKLWNGTRRLLQMIYLWLCCVWVNITFTIMTN